MMLPNSLPNRLFPLFFCLRKKKKKTVWMLQPRQGQAFCLLTPSRNPLLGLVRVGWEVAKSCKTLF